MMVAPVILPRMGIVSVFHDVAALTPLLFALIGLTWAFHISFTLWIIPRGQSDLTYHGTFFSLVVIYLMNLLLLTALLIFAAPEVTFTGFADEFLANADKLYSFVGRLF